LLEREKRVPVTIISGFLGAGKSTLVKRVLTERHGYRIAVIMNEFGDTADIEAKTINVSSDSQQSEEFLELANGCLCCSIKDSGVAAIENLMKRKGAFDYILLETTGLADPGPIAGMFWHNEEYSMGLGKDIYLDGVVCLVDAVYGQRQIEEDYASEGEGESVRQVACSDVVLINKTDLAPEAQISTLESIVHGINPLATTHRTTQSNIELGLVMNLNAYASRIPAPSVLEKVHHHDHADGKCSDPESHPKPTHYTIRGISSILLPVPVLPATQVEVLDEWIRKVLWEHKLPNEEGVEGLDVLRCKGMFRTDEGEIYVLQGVREMYDLSPVESTGDSDGAGEIGKLVFIGKGLDDRVRRSLEATVCV